MNKKRKKNKKNRSSRYLTGIAIPALVVTSVLPGSVNAEELNGAANDINFSQAGKITKAVYKNSSIEFAYESNGSTVKLLSLNSAKSTSLSLPNEIDGLPVTEIAPYFIGNLKTVFSSITLPSQLEKIGDFAFNTATVTELTLPSSLKYIGESAFALSLIKVLTIPQSVEYMGARAFEKSPLTSLSFETGSRLETIDMYTFYYAKLTSLTLPDNLKRINTGAFYYSPLTTLNLNDGLEVIENRGFLNAQLTSINFPSTLRLVGGNAFKTSSFGINTANGYENIVWNEPIWNDEQSVFGSRTNELRNALKAKETVFKGLNYSLSYRIVGDEVFISQLESLTEDVTSLEIPDYIEGKKVVYIGNRFSEKISINSKVQKLRLPTFLEEVGGYAFDKLVGITEMNYPSTLTKLGAGAFRRLQLTSLEIPEGVDELSDSTFYDSPLTYLKLPSTLRKINYNAFYKAKLTNLTIPNSVDMIGNGAFYSSELTELTLPDSLEIIQGSAFNTSPLTKLVVPEGVRIVSLSSFKGASLDYLEIGNPNITYDQYSTDITKVYKLNADATIRLLRDSTTHRLPGTTNYNLSFIGENTAPMKTSEITNQKINQDQELNIDLSKHFTDSDGDTLTYEVTVSDSKGVVTFEGNTLKFISNTVGDYSVTVKATDGRLYSEESTFKVTVEETDIAPTISSSLENNKEYKNHVTPTFDIKNATNVEYMLNGNPYILGTPITNKGENKLVVVASNESKTTTQTYTFIIVSNEPPKAVKQIGDQTVVKDEILKINLNDYYTDADGDKLTFNARTSDDVASRVWITPEGELKFTSAYIDQYTITISATDGIGSSEELSFKVNVVDQQVETPKVPVEEGKLPSVTNYKLVENIPLVGIGTKKTIFIDGLLNEFDLDKLSPTIKTTDGKTVDTIYDSDNKTLTFEALKSGFSNVQVQVQDETGNKAALLFMIDVYEASNTSPNYIANGSIKLGAEAYVVKLDEVYADVSNSESVTYQVSVTKDGIDHPEEVKVEEKVPNSEEIMKEEAAEAIENDAISEEESTTKNEAVPSLEEKILTTPVAIGINRKGLLASINMMPFVNVANNETDTFVFEVPAGVSATTLHDDDNLNIRLVNGKLVVEGKQVGMYNVTVQAETTTGSIASPVNFYLAVLPPDNTGGGTNPDGGSTGGGNNGSDGGSTGGGNNGSDGGSTGGGNNGSDGGSTGG
ncbi:leucine-rich repeat protein, partial [Lysinibacillus fusiformis]